MKNINSFFKNKKAFTLSANKLVSLILLAIVIIIVISFVSNSSQEATQNVESMFEPYTETQCKLGYFDTPINCDRHSSICSDEEIETWEEVRKKVEEFDCDDGNCSCVETELLELVEGSSQDIPDVTPTFPSFFIENKFEGEQIGDIEVYIQTRDGFLEFQYERDDQWLYRSPSENEDTQNLQDLVQNVVSSSRADGLGYILHEYKKENSQIQELGVGLNVVYENINRVELIYQNIDEPTMSYYQFSTNEPIFTIKSNNDEYFLDDSQIEGFFTYDNVENVTCDTITLSIGGNLQEFKNFDISCSQFSDFDFQTIEEFSQEFNIDVYKLYAILDVESNNNFFNEEGYPSLRFECIRFNRNVPNNQKVPCETNSQNPFGIQEHTNFNAFQNAIQINEEQALLQTSYGIGQIMGFHHEDQGFDEVQEFYESMFTPEGQVVAYLKFLSQQKPIILSELKKEDTNWRTVAYHYNGEDFEKNNYDQKLEQAYNTRIS